MTSSIFVANERLDVCEQWRFAGFLTFCVKHKCRLLRWRLQVCTYGVKVGVTECVCVIRIIIRNVTIGVCFFSYDFEDGDSLVEEWSD